MQINNVHDLYLEVVGNDKQKSPRYYMAMIFKEIYQGTRRCVWISCDSQGIHIGSIVKGWEEEIRADVLPWGCNSEEFRNALNWVEAQAEKFWGRKWRGMPMVDIIMKAYLARSESDWIMTDHGLEESESDIFLSDISYWDSLLSDLFDYSPSFKRLTP